MSIDDLENAHCQVCTIGAPPLTASERERLQGLLSADWRAEDERRLVRDCRFPDFAAALAFTNRVGALAEQEGHHPDIHLSWGRVRLVIWTHKCGGLTESDFVLAAKVERLIAA